MFGKTILTTIFVTAGFISFAIAGGTSNNRVSQLANEVHDRGWIVYSARGDNGTWDLFLSRPDGSQKRNITNTPMFEEGGARFSPYGKKLLYRRYRKRTALNHDLWGFQGSLFIADANGANPTALGKEGQYSWASWSPDGKQISCLTQRWILIVDLDTREVVNKLPRQGIFQQFYWSPDGKWFCGVANYLGEIWTIARLNISTGQLNPTHRFQSCTPDWFPDSKHIIFSCRPSGQSANNGYGWTQLWMVDGDGQNPRLVFGQDGYHIYGGVVSPDGKYVMFTKCPQDGGGAESAGAPMFIMRLEDVPTIEGTSHDLRQVHPNTKNGPVLQIADGWEPCWTYAEIK